MNPTVYIETSVISYLTARPSGDLVIAARQQITHDWWEYRGAGFNLYASQLVVREAGKGDKQAAEKRLNVLKDIPLLKLKAEAVNLADIFVRRKAMPEKFSEDALHIALATVYDLDYLMTWNCRHIANAEIQKKTAEICINEGYGMPVICTPDELMGE